MTQIAVVIWWLKPNTKKSKLIQELELRLKAGGTVALSELWLSIA